MTTKNLKDVLLESETPLYIIAKPFDIPIRFDQGMETPTQAIVAQIHKLRAEKERLAELAKVNQQQIDDLKEENSRLKEKVTNAAVEMDLKLKKYDEKKAADIKAVKEQKDFEKTKLIEKINSLNEQITALENDLKKLKNHQKAVVNICYFNSRLLE